MKIAAPFLIKRAFGSGKTYNRRTSRKNFRVYAWQGSKRAFIGLGTLTLGKFPCYCSGAFPTEETTVIELPPMTVLRDGEYITRRTS